MENVVQHEQTTYQISYIYNINMFMLFNTISENLKWERSPSRLRIGHNKLKPGHYMSREQPVTFEDCGKDTPLTIKHILRECPSLNNRKRQFFALPTKQWNSSSTMDLQDTVALYIKLLQASIYYQISKPSIKILEIFTTVNWNKLKSSSAIII